MIQQVQTVYDSSVILSAFSFQTPAYIYGIVTTSL